MDRRRFLTLGGAFAGAVSWSRLLAAAPSLEAGGAQRKLLIVFLRGGNDGLNTVLPLGDAEYFDARPTLAVPESLAIDAGNAWAALHPALAPLEDMLLNGELAAVQRVGYPSSSLSHFSGQRYIETAVPGDNGLEVGFVNRWLAASGIGGTIPAACVARQQQRMFQGELTVPHVASIGDYTLGEGDDVAKLLGELPSDGDGGTGLAGAYARAAELGEGGALVRGTGKSLVKSLGLLEGLPPLDADPDSFPTDPGHLASLGLPPTYDAWQFLGSLRDALRILTWTDARVAGVDLFNFDTHAAQGALAGRQPGLLAVLAHGLRSVRAETAPSLWSNLVVVAISEFGRTSRENGSRGTDHGTGGVLLAAGGPVRGGIYNCDATSWPAGTLSSQEGRYVAHLTDYRALLAEVLERHLGSSPAVLEAAIPGWSTFAGSEFEYVGLL